MTPAGSLFRRESGSLLERCKHPGPTHLFVERLWRSLKYEQVYLKAYESVAQPAAGSAPTSNSTTINGCTRHSVTALRSNC